MLSGRVVATQMMPGDTHGGVRFGDGDRVAFTLGDLQEVLAGGEESCVLSPQQIHSRYTGEENQELRIQSQAFAEGERSRAGAFHLGGAMAFRDTQGWSDENLQFEFRAHL